MIRRSVREWDHLHIGQGADTISRLEANRLLAVARRAQRALRVGGEASESILIDFGNKLRSGQVVGVLAAPGVSLEILPKIGGLDDDATRTKLVRMLARTINLSIADGALTKLGHQHFDLLEILIRLFCDKLFAALHMGLPRRYLGHENDLAALRGRLDIKRQFTTLAMSPQTLACRYEDLSVDIPLNQVFKAAIRQLRGISQASENQRRLIELEFAFADVAMLPAAASPCQSIVLDRTNTDWHDLLRLAQLLLGNRFQTTSSGENQGFSLLFEMNILFEEFVGRVLKRAFYGTELSVTLQGPRAFALSEIGGNKPWFMTKPDIVIHRGGKPVMIIDTKWKRLRPAVDGPKQGVSQSDLYQMMAYGQIYGVDRLMLLYPHHRELEAAGLQSAHLVVGTIDTRLSAATVNLSQFETIAMQLAGLCHATLKQESEPRLASGG
jgi:5-methylcytosine-specific restriction enzyme subunit McrC